VGDGEGLLHTTDGGQSWTPVHVALARTAVEARHARH